MELPSASLTATTPGGACPLNEAPAATATMIAKTATDIITYFIVRLLHYSWFVSRCLSRPV